MLTQNEIRDLKIFSCEIRKKTLTAIHGCGGGHIGGAMSMVEALAVLYGKVMNIDPKNPRMPERDRFVLSKGHSGPSLYAALSLLGFFPEEALLTMNKPNTILPSHVDRNKTLGVDYSTGSLGQGISLAVGSALGARLNHASYRTYCILGDGECDEGQVWEAFLFAAQHNVDNLTVLIDCNKQQLDGWTKDVCNLGDMQKKLELFGWYVQTVDGHDVSAIYDAIQNSRQHKSEPSVILLDTVKGKGCTFAEKAGLCHWLPISDEVYKDEISRLDDTLAQLKA